jgi:hypothetical protein
LKYIVFVKANNDELDEETPKKSNKKSKDGDEKDEKDKKDKMKPGKKDDKDEDDVEIGDTIIVPGTDKEVQVISSGKDGITAQDDDENKFLIRHDKVETPKENEDEEDESGNTKEILSSIKESLKDKVGARDEDEEEQETVENYLKDEKFKIGDWVQASSIAQQMDRNKKEVAKELRKLEAKGIIQFVLDNKWGDVLYKYTGAERSEYEAKPNSFRAYNKLMDRGEDRAREDPIATEFREISGWRYDTAWVTKDPKHMDVYLIFTQDGDDKFRAAVYYKKAREFDEVGFKEAAKKYAPKKLKKSLEEEEVEKSGKIKVKVPVHMKSGKVIMGYRYKGLTNVAKRKKLVRDVPPYEEGRPSGVTEYVEKKLLSPESDIWEAEAQLFLVEELESAESNLEDLLDGYESTYNRLITSSYRGVSKEVGAYLKFLESRISSAKKDLDEVRNTTKVLRANNGEKESELQDKLMPGYKTLKRIGEQAIKVALKKAGFSKIKIPEELDWENDIIEPREWQDAWAGHANNSGRSCSDVLQYVMSKRLPEGVYAIPPSLKKITSQISKTNGYDTIIKAGNVVLDVVRSRSQAILSKMGYKPNDYIYLYRGMRVTVHAKPGSILNLKKLKHNPLSSWSIDPSTAARFGNHLFVTKVKIKDIMSIYLTGLGCRDESEVLIPADVASVAKVLS